MENKEKKIMLKEAGILFAITLIAGLVLAVFGIILRQEGEGIHYFVWIAVVLVVASVFYKAFTLKCPHCGAFLPAKYKLPETCPACNKSVLEVDRHEEADA